MITADKLTAKEIYINLISMTNCKPSSQIYFDNLFLKTCQTVGMKYVYYSLGFIVTCVIFSTK